MISMIKFSHVKNFLHRYPFVRKILYPAILIRRLILRRNIIYREAAYEDLCKIPDRDPVVRVDEFRGIFVMDHKSDLFKRFFIYNEYEPFLVDLVHKYLHKNRDAIDIGANIGFYTVLFAKSLNSGKVLAIEPTSNAIRRLYRNIKLNNVMNKVIVFDGAASDHVGKGEIKILNGKEEYSTLGMWGHPSVKYQNYATEIVKISTVDNMVDKYALNPGFIKIDVEGLEYLVLKGALTTMKSKRPIILTELSDCLLKQNSSSSLEVINYVKSFNYRIIDAETKSIKLKIKNFTSILCVPEELRL